jgi:hypothetical protein
MVMAGTAVAQFRTVDGVRTRYADRFGLPTVIARAAGSAFGIHLDERPLSWALDPGLGKCRRVERRVSVEVATDTTAEEMHSAIRANYLVWCTGVARPVSRPRPETSDRTGSPCQLLRPVALIKGCHEHIVPLATVEFLDERRPSRQLVISDACHCLSKEASPGHVSSVVDSKAFN